MDEGVVQAGGGEVVAQPFQGQGLVAEGELQLFRVEARVRLQAAAVADRGDVGQMADGHGAAPFPRPGQTRSLPQGSGPHGPVNPTGRSACHAAHGDVARHLHGALVHGGAAAGPDRHLRGVGRGLDDRLHDAR